MASHSTKRNSFKELERMEATQHPQPSPEIEHSVMGTARNLGFIGNVVELYLSKALSVISALFGGKDIEHERMEGGSTDPDSDTPSGHAI